MSSFREIINYLESFVNYEKAVDFPYKKNLKLRRVEYLLEISNIPYHSLKVIHIAGTKGKGSTANFCADLLAVSGFKTGLFTSPHFFDFRERITVKTPLKNQKGTVGIKTFMIPRKRLAGIVKEMKPFLEKIRSTEEFGQLSFFEVYTAIAFKYFIEEKTDFVVLETGLGGRLDATNVVKPLVSVITTIGYDHTDKLGNRLADIAYEKAGIIKRGVPVVSSLQKSSVSEVIERKSKSMKSELFVYGREIHAKIRDINKGRTIFDFDFLNHEFKRLKISLKGRCQVENACLALAAVLLLKKRGLLKKDVNFKDGLAKSFIEGRFEVVRKQPLVIMDIAHNPTAFSVLRKNINLYFPSREIILIFASSKDKDVKGMLRHIDYSCLILTRFNNPRSFTPQEIREKVRCKDCLITEDIKEAFTAAKRLYKKNSLILISGSFFLVSEAKEFLAKGIGQRSRSQK